MIKNILLFTIAATTSGVDAALMGIPKSAAEDRLKIILVDSPNHKAKNSGMMGFGVFGYKTLLYPVLFNQRDVLSHAHPYICIGMLLIR